MAVDEALQQPLNFTGHRHLVSRLLLATLSGRPIRISQLRSSSTNPGLTRSETNFVRLLDATVPAHAAIMYEASRIGSGAGYTAFDGELPEVSTHWAVAAPYAHATAPLRRLQDRYVSDCCLGHPDREALPDLPATMAAGSASSTCSCASSRIRLGATTSC